MQATRGAGRYPPATVDVLVVGLVAVPTLMDAWWNEPGTRQADAVTYLLAAASVLALLARRRAPVAVAVGCGIALTGLYLLGHHGELLNLPVMVALYTLAVQGDRRRSALVAVIAATWSGLLGLISAEPLGAPGGSPVLEMLWPLVPLLLGELVRSYRQLEASAAVEREREAERRVSAERTRMAQELHDVLAHTMAAVNVQMTAAAAAFDSHPEVARAALHQAQSSSRSALAELRTLLHLVRGDLLAAPAPGLAQLDELAAAARDAGISTQVVCDAPAGLPAAVELTAYRVVQEALTNTIRHSGASRADVTVAASSSTLTIEVRDNGTTSGLRNPRPASFGLVGMRERVEAHGGQLHHGPRADGGFLVHAVVPLDGGSR